jgi:sugar phosphate isomerase/epimerase
MSYFSLTTWSLHRSLGPLRMTQWNPETQEQIIEEVPQPANIELTALPAIAAERNFKAMDVCHFNFPSTSPQYLQQLRQAFADADVTFYTLLVDYGDISSSDPVRRSSDIAYIKDWIDVAATVGAERVRVVAGESAPSDTEGLKLAAAALSELIDYATPKNVNIITENFKSLSSTPENCLYLYNACNEQLGLICDFGNFKSTQKYDELAQILPFAESVHAKAHYDENGLPDAPEFQRCLELLPKAEYDGPITIVFDGAGDEWEGITRVQNIVENYL